MLIKKTAIEGAFIVEPELFSDERGFFARTYCQREFQEAGLNPALAQCNISFNEFKGTLRGMHSQNSPHEEEKLVRCTSGSIYDVIIDLRKDSPSYMKHLSAELTSQNRLALYIPKGVYHGFLTLEDSCEVYYQMSEFYVEGELSGVRYDDPCFGISWPEKIVMISERDRTYPDYSPGE